MRSVQTRRYAKYPNTPSLLHCPFLWESTSWSPPNKTEKPNTPMTDFFNHKCNNPSCLMNKIEGNREAIWSRSLIKACFSQKESHNGIFQVQSTKQSSGKRSARFSTPKMSLGASVLVMAQSSGEQSHERLSTASVLQRGPFPCYSLQWYLILSLLTGFLLAIDQHIHLHLTDLCGISWSNPKLYLCLKTARYTMRSRSLKVDGNWDTSLGGKN